MVYNRRWAGRSLWGVIPADKEPVLFGRPTDKRDDLQVLVFHGVAQGGEHLLLGGVGGIVEGGLGEIVAVAQCVGLREQEREFEIVARGEQKLMGLGFGDGRAGGYFARWQFGGMEIEGGVRFGEGQEVFGGITRRDRDGFDEAVHLGPVAFEDEEEADVFLVLDELEQEARGIIAGGNFFLVMNRSNWRRMVRGWWNWGGGIAGIGAVATNQEQPAREKRGTMQHGAILREKCCGGYS